MVDIYYRTWVGNKCMIASSSTYRSCACEEEDGWVAQVGKAGAEDGAPWRRSRLVGAKQVAPCGEDLVHRAMSCGNASVNIDMQGFGHARNAAVADEPLDVALLIKIPR